MRIDELLSITGGKLIGEYKDISLKNFILDSRKLKKEDCFIALKGKKYDASNFINDKIKCDVIITEKYIKLKNKIIIQVNSTYEILEKLIKYYRDKYNINVIAITGSNGKTTTKEILYKILSNKYKVLKNEGNKNNIIGVFETIKNLDDSYDVAIFEVGMNHKGEIKKISDLIKPDIAIITNIGSAHIGNLGSKKNIFKAKMEITSSLKDLLIVNGDSKYLDKTKSYKCGINYNNDLIAYDINLYEKYMIFKIYLDKNYEIKYNNPVKEYIPMILECIKAGIYYKVPIDKIIDVLNKYESYNKRLKMIKCNDYVIIDDSYNASFESVKCGLEYLKNIKGDKIIILGDMLELGKYSIKYHKKINELININDTILTVGNYTKYIYSKHFNNNKELIKYLDQLNLKGKCIYVKGSNSMHLDEIVDYLKNKTVEII